MRLLLTFLLVVSAAGCAYESTSTSPTTTETTQSNAIVNGTRAPQNTFLSESQILSIVFLSDQSGDEFCTGTLIHPRVVLSAEHCIDDVTASSLFIGFGMMPAERRALLPVSGNLPTPLHRLHNDRSWCRCHRDYPRDNPHRNEPRPVAEGWVGRKVDASGYGETYDNSTTGRRFASVEVIDFDGETVIVDGKGEQGICYGDSGGPILWQPDADTAPVLVGTEQWGDSSCVDVDHLTRVDVVAAWVDEKMALGFPPPLQSCEEVIDRYCDGDFVRGCDGTYDRSEDCSAGGCGYMGPDAGYACLPESCNGIDYFGECEGDILRYCKGDRLRQRDCAARGQSCIYEGDDVGYNCGDCQRCGTSSCVDFESDINHCGGCGISCSLPNAEVGCTGARCDFLGCVEGFEDADGDESNGCEAATDAEGNPNGNGDGNDGSDGGSGTKSGGSDGGCSQAPLALSSRSWASCATAGGARQPAS